MESNLPRNSQLFQFKSTILVCQGSEMKNSPNLQDLKFLQYIELSIIKILSLIYPQRASTSTQLSKYFWMKTSHLIKYAIVQEKTKLAQINLLHFIPLMTTITILCTSVKLNADHWLYSYISISIFKIFVCRIYI